jgi:hypothetical protein
MFMLNTRINIDALGGIRTHDLSVQAIKAYASDGEATGTGVFDIEITWFPLCGQPVKDEKTKAGCVKIACVS